MVENSNIGHSKAATVLGYALTLDDFESWNRVALIWATKLTPQERSGLAFAALKSLDEDTAYKIASLVIFGTHNGEAVK